MNRYRESVPNPRTLVVTITQSGETADTLSITILVLSNRYFSLR